MLAVFFIMFANITAMYVAFFDGLRILKSKFAVFFDEVVDFFVNVAFPASESKV